MARTFTYRPLTGDALIDAAREARLSMDMDVRDIAAALDRDYRENLRPDDEPEPFDWARHVGKYLNR